MTKDEFEAALKRNRDETMAGFGAVFTEALGKVLQQKPADPPKDEDPPVKRSEIGEIVKNALAEAIGEQRKTGEKKDFFSSLFGG